MKYNSFKIIIAAALSVVIISACSKKLDLEPSGSVTNANLFTSEAGYKQVLAKVYSSISLVGPNGPNGAADLPSQIISDGGSSDFFRNFWYLQCLSTDEAGWTYSNNTDPLDIHQLSWSSANFSVKCVYYRLFYAITLCNNFITESSDENLGKRNITGTDADKVKAYRDETRYIRAFCYWALMDMFGNPPFVTETTAIGSAAYPPQIARKDLFNYIEKELQELETKLPAPKGNEYGRVDRAAAWALLARMYLNAGVYTGITKYTEAITYCKKITAASYSLHNNYKELMLADNNELSASEFIWTLRYDGTFSQNYGGTTFLVHGPSGYSADSSGLSGSWGCIRFPEQFVDMFDAKDIRGQFWTDGQTKQMTTLLGNATHGYSSSKFRNKTRTGGAAPHLDNDKTYSDIDMPIFRLAEIYFIYAEAVLRGGSGGDNTTALNYLKLIAARAMPNDLAYAATYPTLTLDYIIKERGRELFWEGHRRTDLIRFNLFTTNTYLWQWKGGVFSGTGVDPKYNIYPIPDVDLSANPNLHQNTGY